MSSKTMTDFKKEQIENYKHHKIDDMIEKFEINFSELLEMNMSFEKYQMKRFDEMYINVSVQRTWLGFRDGYILALKEASALPDVYDLMESVQTLLNQIGKADGGKWRYAGQKETEQALQKLKQGGV